MGVRLVIPNRVGIDLTKCGTDLADNSIFTFNFLIGAYLPH